nr:YibE/F family protein [Candidatus Woesebacteria bacterium]
VGLLSLSTVRAAQLVGLGSEEAYFLQFGPTAQINLQGLLLAGILLGALGVLDDIVVSQVSVVHELKAVSPGLSFEELYQRGLEVGRDHVASLVNTLVLAYAGANLPLFLLFYLNTQSPFWVTLNSDIIAEEVLRTLVGSVALVTAVPVATALAAWVYTRQEADEPALKSVSSSGKKKSTMRHRHEND